MSQHRIQFNLPPLLLTHVATKIVYVIICRLPNHTPIFFNFPQHHEGSVPAKSMAAKNALLGAKAGAKAQKLYDTNASGLAPPHGTFDQASFCSVEIGK